MTPPLLPQQGNTSSRLAELMSGRRAFARTVLRAQGSMFRLMLAGATMGLIGLGRIEAQAQTTPAAPAPPIAGVLADPGDTIERWCWSGAWVYPVGDPRTLGAPESPVDAGYRVLRPVLRGRHGVTHQGADLGNRAGGGSVRTAASGLVVRAANSASNGYGEHIVIAHRLDEGGLVYSVYAHLIKGSTTVREGEIVPAGQLIGRVGRTGRASTEHLHFEIRRPRNQELRWENAAVEDPLAFIQKRLTSSPDSTSWATPYLAWAEASALIERNTATTTPLERSTWWSMLARAARHSLHDLPSDVELAKRLLSELGVLNDRSDADRARPVEWAELREDLKRLADVGIRLPACLAFGKAAGPASERGTDTSAERGKTPTLADACFELAELASPRSTRTQEPLPRP